MAKVCPECNSTKFVKCGWSVVNRTKVQRYRCEKCLRTFIHPKWSGSRGKDASTIDRVLNQLSQSTPTLKGKDATKFISQMRKAEYTKVGLTPTPKLHKALRMIKDASKQPLDGSVVVLDNDGEV
jgi:hypothetical protein